MDGGIRRSCERHPVKCPYCRLPSWPHFVRNARHPRLRRQTRRFRWPSQRNPRQRCCLRLRPPEVRPSGQPASASPTLPSAHPFRSLWRPWRPPSSSHRQKRWTSRRRSSSRSNPSRWPPPSTTSGRPTPRCGSGRTGTPTDRLIRLRRSAPTTAVPSPNRRAVHWTSSDPSGCRSFPAAPIGPSTRWLSSTKTGCRFTRWSTGRIRSTFRRWLRKAKRNRRCLRGAISESWKTIRRTPPTDLRPVTGSSRTVRQPDRGGGWRPVG